MPRQTISRVTTQFDQVIACQDANRARRQKTARQRRAEGPSWSSAATATTSSWRYLPSGQLDTQFGSGGLVSAAFAGFNNSSVVRAALDAASDFNPRADVEDLLELLLPA